MQRRQVAITTYGGSFGANYRERWLFFFWTRWRALVLNRCPDEFGRMRPYPWATEDIANRVAQDALDHGVIETDGPFLMPIIDIHDSYSP